MSLTARSTNFFVSFFSPNRFYQLMNYAYKTFHNKYYMLHYPFYENEDDDFVQSQKNLINHCLSKIPSVKGKVLLDVGCGNGIQGLYISEAHEPSEYIGIDISSANIKIANEMKEKGGSGNISFYVDNAESLTNIKDHSIDVLVNIESAFHYPDKMKFLHEIYRVLKPGGEFIIADILTASKGPVPLLPTKKNWGVYHHWSYEQYRNSFPSANLELKSAKDISASINAGFRNYKNWFKGNRASNLLKQWISELFIYLNAKAYSRITSGSRLYYVFAGTKPARDMLLNH